MKTNYKLTLAALAGVSLGVAGVTAIHARQAKALTQLMKTMLFRVTATDPATMAAVSMTLIAVTLLACYIPARRAMSVDPVIAVRAEHTQTPC